MLPINYPEDKNTFEKEYIKELGISDKERERFKKFLNRKGHDSPTLDDILIEQINILLPLWNSLNFSIREQKWLKLFFNYDQISKNKFQPKVKAFFEKNLKIKTCYYCNLDLINAFNDMDDYHDSLDFIKRASIEDLCKIKNIGEKTAKKISQQAGSIKTIDDLKNIRTTKKNIESMLFKEGYSHFTLDHVLDKGSYPLFGLSLYNFVPSCYACNSKFKGSKQFIDAQTVNYLSPTSKTFSFNEDVKFKLNFHNGKDKDSISLKSDFILDFSYAKNEQEYKKYIETFKLKGRYIFHKNEVVALVKKKVQYSDSKIQELADNLGITNKQKIKEDIFGKELFDGELEDKSMTKFKRDIAKEIGIL